MPNPINPSPYSQPGGFNSSMNMNMGANIGGMGSMGSMGGGFGGCTINLVKENAIDALLADIIPAYEEVMQLPLSFYIASVENGTEIVQS